MILIVGANGSMGQRYQAILKYLGKNHICVDVDKSLDEIKAMYALSDGVILSTPTETHLSFLKEFTDIKKPILCEKPISMNPDELKEFFSMNKKTKLTMMMQYAELLDLNRYGLSYYDYFRHGKNGIVWDCMQIISLAKSDVHLFERSPIWSCKINGQKLALSEMDRAYVSFVDKWISGYRHDHDYLVAIHQKVKDYEGGFNATKS